ncbi:hypothetical protein LSM04_003479 [Trypanosoma melophagium]|uniref:uncharacterized protein n=1 Tax=Trypanosoma melophagium TaxID=715481 RepID=UPI00351A2E5C|nr:hypothetical protein LSM04_003479 [Trypanosoma melophagium]
MQNGISRESRPIILKSEKYISNNEVKPLYEEKKSYTRIPSDISDHSDPHLPWPKDGEKHLGYKYTKSTQTEENNNLLSTTLKETEIKVVNSFTLDFLDEAIQKNGKTLLRLQIMAKRDFIPLMSPSRDECIKKKQGPSSCISRLSEIALCTSYLNTKKGERLPVCFLGKAE